jgi:hypothetical protein
MEETITGNLKMARKNKRLNMDQLPQKQNGFREVIIDNMIDNIVATS